MGAKYVIEFEDRPFINNGENLYRVKGFNSLVFDKNGVSKLKPYRGVPSDKYATDMERMQEETWKLAKNIFDYWNHDSTGYFSIEEYFNMRPEEARIQFDSFRELRNGYHLTICENPKDGEQVVVKMRTGVKGTGWRNGQKDIHPWFLIVGKNDHISRHSDEEVLSWVQLP